MRYLLVATLVLLAGCNASKYDSPVSPTDDNEAFILAETARLSGIAGQHINGSISDKTFYVNCIDGSPGCHAAGWYEGQVRRGAKGTAWFYQPDVLKNAPIDLTWMAAHEICHSVTGPEHDAKHAECNKTLAGGLSPW